MVLIKDSLTRAVEAIDLPALVLEFAPDSKARPGVQDTVFATWRQNTSTPAFSLFRREGMWLWADKATGETGNAFNFLVEIVGMEKQEAALDVMKRAGISPESPREGAPRGRKVAEAIPVPVELAKRHTAAPPVKIKALAGRGFITDDMALFGIIKDGDDALIPIMSPDGVVLAIKRRRADGNPKYIYEPAGHGTPAWCSPNTRASNVLIITEGELNGMIAHSVLHEAGYAISTMGIAGAESQPNLSAVAGKTVFIYADADPPGLKAREVWAEAVHEAGARAIKLMAPHPQDFCDVAGEHKRTGLAEHLKQLMDQAVLRYGPMERIIAGYSAMEHLESAKRYINNQVINPTGFWELDGYTGGIPESGIILWGGLPSKGKSSLLRRVLLEPLKRDSEAKAGLISPDQSPQSVFRLLATTISGVPMGQVRINQFSPWVIERFGSPEAARKRWQDVYTWVVLEFSKRFLISEESELGEIKEIIPRWVDQGVTVFGGDYAQLFEPDGDGYGQHDGKAIKDFKKGVRKWRVPFHFAIQLAKSKFPPTRKSGLPHNSDIEGSGAYFQVAEQCYMLYNDDIYAQKYAGEGWERAGDPHGCGRVTVEKNKEGASGKHFFLPWEPEFVTYRNHGTTVWDEYRGLLE